MLRSFTNPTLILLQHGKPLRTIPLGEGITRLGRSADNGIVLSDASVSRHHAEIEVRPDGIRLRDAGSRNGVLVNGVPRREASLQPGDRLRFGAVELEFATGFVKPVAPAVPVSASAIPPPPDETRRSRAPLPSATPHRQLAAVYHLCFSIAEGLTPENAETQLLELLLESAQARLAQYYAPNGNLAHSATAEKIGRAPKFAAYLFEKFQSLTEATAYASHELARFQVQLGKWHFLVMPLRAPDAPDTTPAPLIVLARPAEWQEFSTDDRVLLTAAGRLWVRSQPAAPTGIRANNASAAGARPLPAATMIGDSPALQTLRARLDRIAPTKATVLVTGETGCGKEVVAQYLHDRSPRRKGPFVKVNCAAIPHSLMESELFGYVKGAFTDAKSDRSGKFQQADGGTLFLDEIGELPLAVQAKLLRALESGEIERIGSERVAKVDVRILAATNRDLREEVRRGTFREDLLYRLEVAKVLVPPLREHPEDIAPLARHFLAGFCAENGLGAFTFSPEAIAVLEHHRWPGNVRELRNVVQRVALEARPPTISAPDVQAVLV